MTANTDLRRLATIVAIGVWIIGLQCFGGPRL